MVASDSFAEFLREQLAPLGRVTMRRMFGKTGVFCDGLMFGMVTDDTLYFRVDDQNRAAFKEAESFPPLNYAKKGPTIDLSFWRAPERLFDEPDELVAWARAALEAARRVAAKRERTAHEANAGTPGAPPNLLDPLKFIIPLACGAASRLRPRARHPPGCFSGLGKPVSFCLPTPESRSPFAFRPPRGRAERSGVELRLQLACRVSQHARILMWPRSSFTPAFRTQWFDGPAPPGPVPRPRHHLSTRHAKGIRVNLVYLGPPCTGVCVSPPSHLYLVGAAKDRHAVYGHRLPPCDP